VGTSVGCRWTRFAREARAGGGRRAASFAALACLALARPALPQPPPGPLPSVQRDVRLASPLPSRRAERNPPAVRVELPEGAGEVALFLDGTDVTPLSKRAARAIVFRPQRGLAEGEHRVEVIVGGAEGRSEWRFTTGPAGPAGAGQGRKAFAQGGISATASETALQKPDVASGRVRLSGNLGQTVGVKAGDVEASLNGNVRYLKDAPGREVELTGFLATLKRDKDSLSYGDVAFKGTPLVAPSVARRGVLASAERLDTQVQLFQVSTQAVNGWNGGVDFASSDNQMFGGSVSRAVLPGDALKLQAAYVDGRDARGGAAYNAATTDAARRGRAASLVATGQIAKTSYTVEAGWARLEDRTLGPDSRTDGAFSLQVARPILGVNLSAGYQRIGTDFASIASPNASGDRQQLALSGSTSVGVASLSATASRANDNLKVDPARPVVVATSLGGTFGLAAARWPALTVSYVRGMLDSTREPAGVPRTDNVTDNVVGALAYNGKAWSSSLSATRSWTNNRLPVSESGSAAGYQAALNLRPAPRVGASGSVGWTEADTAGVTRRSGVAALNLNMTVLRNLLDVAGQGSLSRSTASDSSVDARTVSGGVRATLDVHELVKRWFSYGRQNLALSWTYSRSEDLRGPAPSPESYAVFVSLDFFFPAEGSLVF
jgi:hypothetical protein